MHNTAFTRPQSPFGSNSVYYRLVALWVVFEALLGGIIHGLRLPVSGLVVGSSAIACICLIARYVPQKGKIIKATIIVAIFKMMLSPQAPLPAYFAVFFQGAIGELIFWKRRFYVISCLALAVLGLLESGLQRIITLTIISGNDLWVAINSFLNGLSGQQTTTNYSLWIGGLYVGMHLLGGVLLGLWISTLPKRIEGWRNNKHYLLKLQTGSLPLLQKNTKHKGLRRGLFVMWLILIGLYVQSYYHIGQPLLSADISLNILVRSIIIVLSWVFLVSPLLTKLLHQWLQKKQNGSQKDVQEVLQLLPSTKWLIHEAWKKSSDTKGLKRLNTFTKIILVNSLSPLHERATLIAGEEAGPVVYILTGQIGSGKTTSVLNWAKGQENVYGIATPVLEGKRVFKDLHSGQQFEMEAEVNEESVTVGRYQFRKKGFEQASQIIHESINRKGWLVIDEIGPLEIRGEGYSSVLKEVLELRKEKLLLVVRKGLADRIKEVFAIPSVAIINSVGYLTQSAHENVVSNHLAS